MAAAPAVELTVVGKHNALIWPTTVTAGVAKVSVAARRCSVAAATPLAALAQATKASGMRVGLRDYGRCSGKVADSTNLFVNRIGNDLNKGRDGWVYKVNRKVGTTSASDLSGALGNGKLLSKGSKLLWFYCKLSAEGNCQPTLEVAVDQPSPQLGQSVTVTVRSYDDRGRGGKPVTGVTLRVCAEPLAGKAVSSCGVIATTGADGKATVVPHINGPQPVYLVAERSGYVTGVSTLIKSVGEPF